MHKRGVNLPYPPIRPSYVTHFKHQSFCVTKILALPYFIPPIVKYARFNKSMRIKRNNISDNLI